MEEGYRHGNPEAGTHLGDDALRVLGTQPVMDPGHDGLEVGAVVGNALVVGEAFGYVVQWNGGH